MKATLMAYRVKGEINRVEIVLSPDPGKEPINEATVLANLVSGVRETGDFMICSGSGRVDIDEVIVDGG